MRSHKRTYAAARAKNTTNTAMKARSAMPTVY